MNHHLLATLALLSGMGFGGVVFGVVYFAALSGHAGPHGTGRGAIGSIVLVLGRIAAAILIFALPLLGVLPLLAALLGFLFGPVIVRRASTRRRAEGPTGQTSGSNSRR